MACRTVLALESVARNNTATHYACQVRLRSWWCLTPKVYDNALYGLGGISGGPLLVPDYRAAARA